MENLQFPDYAGRLLRPLFGIFLAIAITLLACSDPAAEREISVADLHELSQSDSAMFLLDVRTAGEYQRVRLPFTDARIPYDSLEFALDRLPGDLQTRIYCFCVAGVRSGKAAEYLRSVGYERVYNVKGGLRVWTDSGYDVERD